jgi:hypothetical protein
VRTSQNKGNFDNSSNTDSHEGVSEHGVRSSTNHELLRMSRHAPASDKDDKSGNKVALWISIAVLAEPDTYQASRPPYNAHCGMLPVILDPVGAPAMLGKGVDTAPCGNCCAVVKLLRPTVSANPKLTNDQENCEKNTVSDECASHDEMSGALAGVISLTKAQGSNTAKDHLCPGHYWHQLSNDGMAWTN